MMIRRSVFLMMLAFALVSVGWPGALAAACGPGSAAERLSPGCCCDGMPAGASCELACAQATPDGAHADAAIAPRSTVLAHAASLPAHAPFLTVSGAPARAFLASVSPPDPPRRRYLLACVLRL